MANPQKENGYTAIANEILDVLCKTKLAAGERQILDVILRKTYGFNKKQDRISYQQFEDITNLKRRAIIYVVQNLQAKGIVRVWKNRNDKQNDPNTYQFNKNYEEWVVQNSAPQVKANRLLAKKTSAKLRKSVGSAKPMSKVVQKSVKSVNSFAPTKDIIKVDTKDRDATHPTPKEKAKFFFKGVTDFLQKNPSEQSDVMKGLLTKMSAEQGIENIQKKKAFWDEIVAFSDYWQEKDHLGKRERWEMQKTFEVEKRLQTWLRKAGQWAKAKSSNNYNQSSGTVDLTKK